MTSCPKDCWGVRVDWPKHEDVDVTGSPWLTGSCDGDMSDPKRVLCDRLVRGEMNQTYITALGTTAANDLLTHAGYVSGYLRPWLLLNAPDLPCESAYHSEGDGPETAAEWYFLAYNAIKANDGHSGGTERTLIGGPSLYGTFDANGASWWLERFLAKLDDLNANKSGNQVNAKLEFYAVHDWQLRGSSYGSLEDHLDWVNNTMATVQNRTCLDADVDVWISETGHLAAADCATAIAAMQALRDWLLASGFASYRIKKVFWLWTWNADWYSGGTPESPGTLLYWPVGGNPANGLYLTDTGKAWEEVKMSMVPMCKVYRATAFGVAYDTDVYIGWTGERFNTDDMHPDNDGITINTPGTYDITFNHGQPQYKGDFEMRAMIRWLKADGDQEGMRDGPRAYARAYAWPSLGLHTTLKLGAGGLVRVVVHHKYESGGQGAQMNYWGSDAVGEPGPELTVKLVSFDY